MAGVQGEWSRMGLLSSTLKAKTFLEAQIHFAEVHGFEIFEASGFPAL